MAGKLQLAVINAFSTSYDLVLSSGELSSTSAEKCASEKQLKEIIDACSAIGNFSGKKPSLIKFPAFLVVELVDEAASLYAHDAQDQPVCVLLKKAVSVG